MRKKKKSAVNTVVLFSYLERLNEAQHLQGQSAAGMEQLLQAGKKKKG